MSKIPIQEKGDVEHFMVQNASFLIEETRWAAKWYLMYWEGRQGPVLGKVVQRQCNIANICMILWQLKSQNLTM